ncbi:hypothetical protein ACQY0O_005147 [Thecaphora frezii]
MQPSAPSPLNPHKKRRLQFTSELPVSIPRYNPDGTETDEWARYQSNLRLKAKWDSICQKFSNAHLLPQDEIYLGNETKGEKMRLIKDRGHLRRVAQPIEFGVFHIRDEDLKHVKLLPGRSRHSKPRLDARKDGDSKPAPGALDDVGGGGGGIGDGEDGDDEGDDDDGFGEWTHTVKFSRMVTAPAFAPATRPAAASAANPAEDADAQLAEFLEAEARRRELCGRLGLDSDEDDGGDDGVLDFTDPSWDAASPATLLPKGAALQSDVHLPKSPSLSSSADEIDIISVSSDIEEERGYRDRYTTKRQHLEDLLTGPSPFETTPYSDIDGLAQYFGSRSEPAEAVEAVEAAEAVEIGDSAKAPKSAEAVTEAPAAPHPAIRTSDNNCDVAQRPASPPPSIVVPASAATPQSKTPASKQQSSARPAAGTVTGTVTPVADHKPKTGSKRKAKATATPSKRSSKVPAARLRATPTPIPRRPSGSSSSDEASDDVFGGAGAGGCLGYGRCVKSFCMQCGSVSASSRSRKLKAPREDEPPTPSRTAPRARTQPSQATAAAAVASSTNYTEGLGQRRRQDPLR